MYSVIYNLISLPLVLVLVLAIPPSETYFPTLIPRIVGGKTADFKDFSFAVYMHNKVEKSFCGGSIISDTWVLTAAHCVKKASAQDLVLFIGQDEYHLDPSKATKVSQIHMHPQYDDQSMVNDIALIQLAAPITTSKASTISIDTSQVGDGDTLTALGWGYTSKTGTTPSTKLKQGQLKTLSKQECAKKDTKFTGNNGPRICVSADGGADTCPGDSGGPLVRKVGGKTVLTGITSFGTAGPGQPITVNCGGPGMVSLFTHADYYMKFIKSTTGELRDIHGSNDTSDGNTSDSASSSSVFTFKYPVVLSVLIAIAMLV